MHLIRGEVKMIGGELNKLRRGIGSHLVYGVWITQCVLFGEIPYCSLNVRRHVILQSAGVGVFGESEICRDCVSRPVCLSLPRRPGDRCRA